MLGIDLHRRQELHTPSILSEFPDTVVGCLLQALGTDRNTHHNHSTARDAVDCRAMEVGS